MLPTVETNKIIWIAVALLCILHFFPEIAAAQFVGGSGVQDDPYQVETLEQLQAIGEEGNLDKHFIQIADIDAGDTENWNDGKGFEPIGSWPAFSGTFDGNSHIISNLVIHRGEEDLIGLFGNIKEAMIKNTGLVNVNINGRSAVGGLVGEAWLSQIYYSFAEGKVNGVDKIGGLIGGLGDSGCQRNEFLYASYAHVEVSGVEEVGGLVGLLEVVHFIHQVKDLNEVYNIKNSQSKVLNLQNEIKECGVSEVFATGQVTGENNVGGLLGYNSFYENFIKRSYWDTESSSQSIGVGEGVSYGIKGLTADQMTGQDAFIHMYKLDFKETWQLTEGYPVLVWQDPENAVEPPEVPIVDVAPENLDFGEVEMDSAKSMEIILKNTGIVTMNGEVLPVGTGVTAFEIIREEGEWTLDPDSSLVIEVIFQPDNDDNFHAVLEISHDAPNEESPLEVTLTGKGKSPVGININEPVPLRFELHQNYPNPFNPVTKVRYSVPEQSQVRLEVYNVLGQRVSTLVNESKSPGNYEATFDADGLSSGVFLYRLQTESHSESRQMLLIK